jgi:LCP family protein required for cell wall assembly
MRAAGRRGLAWAFDIITGALLGLAIWTMYGRSIRDLIALSTRPQVLWGVCVGAAVLAVAWPLTIVLNWLVVRPHGLMRVRLVGSSAFVGVLCLAVALPLVVTSRYAYVQHDVLSSVFSGDSGRFGDNARGPAENVWAGRGRIGVLLLGGDAGPDRTGLRTDTVILASVDTQTGATILFSLPRNLEDAPFPPGELRNAYPHGFPDLLNAIYPTVEDFRPDLLKGREDRGAMAIKQAVHEILGLPVDYYMLVDLKGFQELVNALGGVTINVKQRISYGGIRVDGSHGPPKGWIEAGIQEMNGATALRYARTRDNASDYDRIARQRCVLNAILDQADPFTVLKRYQKLANVAKDNIKTDIPQDLLPAFIDLSEEIKKARVRNVAFVPPLIATGNPDYHLIREKVQEAIKNRPVKSTPTSTTPVSPKPAGSRGGPTPTGGTTPKPPANPGAPEDLDAVC